LHNGNIDPSRVMNHQDDSDERLHFASAVVTGLVRFLETILAYCEWSVARARCGSSLLLVDYYLG